MRIANLFAELRDIKIRQMNFTRISISHVRVCHIRGYTSIKARWEISHSSMKPARAMQSLIHSDEIFVVIIVQLRRYYASRETGVLAKGYVSLWFTIDRKKMEGNLPLLIERLFRLRRCD